MLPLILILAAATVSIARKHTVGQKYAVEYSNNDTQLKVSKTFKGTATVASSDDGEWVFNVSVDSLEWTSAEGKRTNAAGVKLKIEVSPGSVDAEVVSAGTAGEAASIELTAFEHLLGDMCQPPVGPFDGKKKVGDWELVSAAAGVAKLKSSPPPKGDPFTCEISISTEDGFAGERKGLMRVPLKDGIKVEQVQTLKVKKL